MTTDTQLQCDLCIVGAGYAGLNALNAAAKYLKPGARVVVIDKRETWGGQWLFQYDFVRLHQPYRMFTAGDQPWVLQRDPSHLATRREVLDHLASVPSVSAGHLEVQPLFGHAYTSHAIREGRVDVVATPLSGASQPVKIRARRLLLGTGVDVQPVPPFALSSSRVRSLAVYDPLLCTPEFLQSNDPVYIIGSGKTAMDCARHLIQHRSHRRQREVNVISGSGMYYMKRDNICPRGLRRYYGGVLNAQVFLTMCDMFDGQNEAAVMQHMERIGYVHTVWGFAGNFRVAILSAAEREELRAGVDQVIRGHLVDVEGTRMTVRQGRELREHKVPDGAYFIHCASHLRAVPYAAVLQDSGLVCAPQFSLGLSGWSAYFITHLWYRDRLHEIAPNLYRMRFDDEHKLRFSPTFGLMVMANVTMVNERTPPDVLLGYEADPANWYPAYRRIPLLARFLMRRRALLEKADRLLPLRFSDTQEPLEVSSEEITAGALASA
jgi:hypothetical protein